MSAGPADPPHLELRGVTKRYGGLLANDRVDLSVGRGEVHALVGENGAGKTTLMNVVFGLVRPDAGEILLHGRRVDVPSPLAARRLRIGMVHQHFKLVPSLSVAENVFLGQEPVRRGLLDRAAAASRVRALSERFGLAIDPLRRVDGLSVGLRQRVEVLKALSFDAELLILDEPTAVLAPRETRELFATLRALAADGRTVILITHRLDEVAQVAGRFTVMRDGRRVATMATAEATTAEIARLMVGRELPELVHEAGRPAGLVLRCLGLVVDDEDGRAAVRGVDLDVRAGEIVGVAGVEGNGQTELVEALAGLRAAGGRVELGGVDVTRRSALERRRLGLAHIPEDRLGRGLAGPMSVEDNVAGGHLWRGLVRRGLLDLDAVRALARRLILGYDVRGALPRTPVRSLSGGTMQKLVIGRELELEPRVLIAAQPTRGVDVGAIELVRRLLLRRRDDGTGVLLVSADLSEVMALSDRILVMHAGRIVAELPAGTDQETIGLAMMGVTEDPPAPLDEEAVAQPPSAPSPTELDAPPPLPGEREGWRPPLGRVLGASAQPALAILIALAVGIAVVVAIGQDPLAAYGAFLGGSFTGLPELGGLLAQTTPLLLTGLSVLLSFRAGVFNVGAEGQLYLGAFAAAVVGAALNGAPVPVALLAALGAAALAGALWALLPALLLVRWGVGEIVTTLMLNYVAILLTEYLARYPFKDPAAGAPETRTIAAGLPTLIGGSSANAGLLIALLATVATAFVLFRSAWGLRLRLVGENARFASYLGIGVGRTIVQAMLASGGLAGLAGAVQVLGILHRFFADFSPGYGFTGLTVALLGQLDPWGTAAGSLVYGVLINGATIMTQLTDVPYPLVSILQGLVVMLMTAGGLLAWWRRRRPRQG